MNIDEAFGAILVAQGIKEQMATIEAEVERKGGADYKGAWEVLKAHINDTLKYYDSIAQ